MATDAVQICNRALQKLGAHRITSLLEDSRNGRSCSVVYDSIRKATLTGHPWNFAISRAQLAADSTTPIFGRTYAYQVPADYLRLLPPYPEVNLQDLDWVVEGKKIYTNDGPPLNIRYIADITDPGIFDSLFAEALSANIAMELCEELTQSNQKMATLKSGYKDIIEEAKQTNAIQNVQAKVPDDEYITVRN